MIVDSLGVSFGAMLGSSTITAFVESAAGVGAGGRTGLTAVTCGIMFILCLFFCSIDRISSLMQRQPLYSSWLGP